jgi:hypothetical protein
MEEELVITLDTWVSGRVEALITEAANVLSLDVDVFGLMFDVNRELGGLMYFLGRFQGLPSYSLTPAEEVRHYIEKGSLGAETTYDELVFFGTTMAQVYVLEYFSAIGDLIQSGNTEMFFTTDDVDAQEPDS